MATKIVDVTEQKRLNEAREAGIPWKKWGPYLSERQWGTVREDYSEGGNRCATRLRTSAGRDEMLDTHRKLDSQSKVLLANRCC